MSGHAKNVAAQLRAAERDEGLPEDLRERAGERADELEGQVGEDDDGC